MQASFEADAPLAQKTPSSAAMPGTDSPRERGDAPFLERLDVRAKAFISFATSVAVIYLDDP
jgi:hypothetical protein